MFELEYLTDKNGQLKGVVVPIELWKQLFIEDDASAKELSEAMDEGKESPLLSRKEALAYLEA
jgi:hypothetical protein